MEIRESLAVYEQACASGVLDRAQEGSFAGFSPVIRKHNAVQKLRLAEAVKFWAEAVKNGGMSSYLMQQAFNPTDEFAFRKLNSMYPALFHESMTISDFASLTSQTLDKMLLGNWQMFNQD